MTYDYITLAVEDGVALLTLNKPAQLNATSEPMQVEMRDALAVLRRDRSVRALILTGAGRAFCAGAELDHITSLGDAQAQGRETCRAMREASAPLVLDLMEAPFPVVAAVNGVAVGAGVGIALAADIVIAARSAAFVMSFAPKLGLVPDLGSSWMVPRLVGRARAMGMGLLGDKLSAEMAAQWGLIWACVDDAALLATARDTAQRLAAGPRHAAYELRRALMMAEGQDLAAQLEYEAGRQGELIARPEFQEGVAAFFARRAPQFP